MTNFGLGFTSALLSEFVDLIMPGQSVCFSELKKFKLRILYTQVCSKEVNDSSMVHF